MTNVIRFVVLLVFRLVLLGAFFVGFSREESSVGWDPQPFRHPYLIG